MSKQKKSKFAFLKIKKSLLSSWIVDFCLKNKIKLMTPIQQACIPSIILGKDLIVFSRTGTGKTMAYILPGVHRIDNDKKINQMVIIIPTLELGFQIFDIIQKIGHNRKIFFYFFPKELNLKNSEKMLAYVNGGKRCLVSTPNSFFFFLKNKKYRLHNKKNLLTIDEGDLLFGKKFYFEIEVILIDLKPKQVLVFSASMTKNLHILKFPKIKKKIFCFYENRIKFSLINISDQEYFFCPNRLKVFYLWLFLKSKYKISSQKNKEKNFSSIIFVSDPKICHNIARILGKNKISTVQLHENMDHLARLISMQLIKTKQIKILICTDLGSRGLDFPLVSSVINFNFPKKVNTYLHRAGRALRFFRKGKCLNLVDQKEIRFLHYFEKKTGIKITKFKEIKENEIIKILSKKLFKK
ncbi:dbx-like protein (nucleomorph) [Chroomonas mesostigmatica CCMP1168]|uniref:ATP-dependent RNA helicase n=1 Tax=Chroomonas mesostigmatica CCMP1168 TaxID=1195612 RepID=J7G8V9_9CRYP|nr:dbx-like protein [Chroomonas mesostigmatica CCMP1168]|mmetsp:Transcript_13510/g.33069  ORF Transcript_13510/g.33069 Transcript_13510/m.33069 type:complete len:411 (-) Transcript_13510:1525-2757(-)